MSRILIIEDEKNIADILDYGLTKEGFEVTSANRGSEGFNLIRTISPDLVLLDIMLPDINGINICRMINDEYKIPVILLTALYSITDKLQGFEAGAEDYITKPFDIREVIARINTVLKRQNIRNHAVYRIGDVSIEFEKYMVYKAGHILEMTPKEFELLEYLVKHPGIVFNRDILLERIWGYEYLGDTRTIDTHIQRIRKKLEWQERIVTVYGVGYKFVE